MIYTRHIHFIDFSDFGLPMPYYFNQVRDPVERFRSRFYWTRANFQAKDWYRDFWMIEPEADPQKLLSFDEWFNKAFEKCALNRTDPECNLKDGSSRDFAIV